MKSCRNCKNFDSVGIYCKLRTEYIVDIFCANVCKNYQDKRKIYEKLTKCRGCKNLNKYSWCKIKKRCFNEEEQMKIRKCIHYR